MCAKIVNLNELVGDDIVFEYGNPAKRYAIPGDIEVEKVFELFEMFANVSRINAKKPDAIIGEVRQKFEEIQARLLALFQQRDPKLKSLPFGIRGTGIVLRTVLADLGVNVSEESPTRPSRPTARRKASSVKTRTRSRKSQRSTG